MAATEGHATMEELVGVAFSMQSMLKLYNKGQMPLEESSDGSEKSRRLV
jgi:hypothetical protein